MALHVTQEDIDTQVAALLDGVPDGDDLDEIQIALLNFALCSSTAALDVAGAQRWMQVALDAGVRPDQLQEIITMMSALGVHVYFESTRALERASAPPDGWGPFDAHRQELWDEHVGSYKRWTTMHEEIPGFLQALLRMSPEAFEAFIHYAALPFRAELVPNLTKELICMAADACTAHRYLPGMRMHLRNALRMGAGRRAVERAIAIAAESPDAIGVA